MKNVKLYGLSLLCLGILSCKDNKTTAEDSDPKLAEPVVDIHCYQAIYQNDTLNLELSTLKSGAISGTLAMKVFGEPQKTGKVEGKFNGDTLFADYSFTLGTAKDKTFKNPLALLKKDSLLILGNGQIQTTMGKSYLVKDVPIDFERVKYKFSAVNCAVD